MTSPLIDDSLVEMVARAICPKHADGKPIKSRMPGAMYDARAALAVAVPVIGERCADTLFGMAGASKNWQQTRTLVDAADAIRSLTKDTQP